jgi:hypothetical protein
VTLRLRWVKDGQVHYLPTPLSAKTDQDGSYSIVNVAPGSYKLLVNWQSQPDTSQPAEAYYFWPEGHTESEGQVIDIKDSATLGVWDFRLPVKRDQDRR